MVLEAIDYTNEYSLSAEIDKAVLTTKTAETEITVYFDIIKAHSIQVSDNITDNWLEDSTVINDAIGLAPITCTLSGLSGEKIYKPAPDFDFEASLYNAKSDKLGKYADKYVTPNKLSVIQQLLPSVDTYTQGAKNAYSLLKNNIDRYTRIYNDLFGENKKSSNTTIQTQQTQLQTRLQSVYEDLMALRNERTAFTVITPYTTLENMYIQSITFNQENILHATDLNITLKQGNFRETEYTKANKSTQAEYNQMSTALNDNEAVNLGKTQGKFKSLLKGGLGVVGKIIGYY